MIARARTTRTFMSAVLVCAFFACQRPPETNGAQSTKHRPSVLEDNQDRDTTSSSNPEESSSVAEIDGGAPWGPQIDWQAAFEQDAQLSPNDQAQIEGPIFAQFSAVTELEIVEPLECRASLCRVAIEIATMDEPKVLHELSKPDTPVNSMGMTFASREEVPGDKQTITIFLRGASVDLDALPRR